jgi:hypothetical protein
LRETRAKYPHRGFRWDLKMGGLVHAALTVTELTNLFRGLLVPLGSGGIYISRGELSEGAPATRPILDAVCPTLMLSLLPPLLAWSSRFAGDLVSNRGHGCFASGLFLL